MRNYEKETIFKEAKVAAAIQGQQQWDPAEEDNGSKEKLNFLQVHNYNLDPGHFKKKLLSLSNLTYL